MDLKKLQKSKCIVPQKLQSPHLFILFFCLCDRVYPKQEVRFLLYLLVQMTMLP